MFIFMCVCVYMWVIQTLCYQGHLLWTTCLLAQCVVQGSCQLSSTSIGVVEWQMFCMFAKKCHLHALIWTVSSATLHSLDQHFFSSSRHGSELVRSNLDWTWNGGERKLRAIRSSEVLGHQCLITTQNPTNTGSEHTTRPLHFWWPHPTTP